MKRDAARILRRSAPFVATYAGLFTVGQFVMLLTLVSRLILPLLTRGLIDGLSAGAADGFPTTSLVYVASNILFFALAHAAQNYILGLHGRFLGKIDARLCIHTRVSVRLLRSLPRKESTSAPRRTICALRRMSW